MMVVNMVENEEDLNYPANKTHRILKENQIHGSVELVVTLWVWIDIDGREFRSP